MLSSLSIALQGFGFGPAQIAVQGFLGVVVEPPYPGPGPAYDDVGGPEPRRREVWMTAKILEDEREFIELLPLIMRVLP